MLKKVFLIACVFVRSGYGYVAWADISSQVVNKKVLLVATGIPGVGKTFYLKQLSKIVANSVYLDKDIIAETFQGDQNNESEFYKTHVRLQAYQAMLKIAEDNLNSDHVVILDSYFGDKLFTPLFAKYIQPKTPAQVQSWKASDIAKAYVIFFVCDDEKLNHRRIVERGAVARDSDKMDPQRFSVYRRERLAQHKEAFARLRSGYGHIPFLTIHTDDESPEAVERNLREILRFLTD